MQLKHILTAGLIPGLAVAAAHEAPTTKPSPIMPGVVDNCDGFYKVSSGDVCETIARKHDIRVSQFKSWNREVNQDCTNLWLDYYVCVHAPSTTTTTTKEPPKTTDKPTPLMPGVVSNCKSFHKIKDGDNCWSINKEAGITLDQFRSWNKEIDAGCTNLWLGYYVCVGV